MFTGKYCFPLTPPGNGHSIEEDQLKIILKTLGSQDASDLSFITDPGVMNHILTVKPHQPKVDHEIFCFSFAFISNYQFINQKLTFRKSTNILGIE